MSLQLAAQHLAAQGRGPDKQLVHMSPREVAGLQALAMAHGGSLSINPETGLPEAGFLDSLLPTIIGAGLAFATGGTSLALSPAMIGLGVGGIQALRTGDLSKGLMAGLGAYGGAGLFSSLAGPAAATAGSGITAAQTAAPAAQAAQAGVTGAEALYPNLPPPEVYANPFAGTSAEFAGAEAVGRQDLTNYMASKGIGLSPTGEIVSAAPPVTSMPAAPAVAPSSSADFLRGMSDVSAVEGPGVAGAGLPTRSSTFASRLAAMPTKDLAQYGLAAAAPALLAQPEYEKPELDSEQYRYAYSPGPVMPPTRSGDVGEYTYFRPSYTRLAEGGPVEAMSAANIYDMQNARGGVSDMGIDNSTGMQRMAGGGITDLGDYSDGGRLLRGPGDGVSDSIPAVIGDKRPARLADGEFVVPARIVSELGNGSTEAGARKLYAMMDRIQSARGKTTGKGKVAKNTRSEKYLPA